MYHIIVNPVAGRGRIMQFVPVLTNTLAEHGILTTSHVTSCIKDGYNIAKNICEASPDSKGIIGIGGDGTMQEIVVGMVDGSPSKISIPLALFPGGSGNDFVMALEGGKSALKKYKQDTLTAASMFAKKIMKRELRTVDLISANGEAFLVAANIGIDARIVQDAITLKPKYGRQAYLIAAYKSILKHKNTPMKVTVNGETINKNFTLVAICNASTYGGGLPIAPMARFDDGKITLCLVNGMSRLKLGVLFPSLLLKKHVKLKDITFIECTEATITLQDQESLCLDGNLYPKEGEIHFKIMPKILDVFV